MKSLQQGPTVKARRGKRGASATSNGHDAPASIKRPPLTRSFSWALGGNVFYAACQWGMLVVLAKYGSAESVGNFSLGLAIGAPIMLLCNMQLRGVLATDATQSCRFADCLGLRIASTGLGIAAIATTVLLFGYTGRTAAVILWIGLAKSFEAVSDVAYGYLQKHEQLKRIAISMILKGGLTLAAFYVVFWRGGNEVTATLMMALLWGGLLVALDLPMAFQFARSPLEGVRWTPSLADMKRLGILAAPLGVVEMLSSLNVNLPRYAIEVQSGTSELGVFVSMCYVMVAGGTVIHAMSQAAVPRLAQAFSEGRMPDFRRLLHKLLGLTAGVGVLGIIVAAIGGKQLLSTLYRPSYGEHADVFVMVMLAATMHYLSTVLWFGLTATRHFRIQLPLFLGTLLPNLLLCWWLTPLFGMLGAASAFAIAEAGRGVCSYWLICRIIRADKGRNASFNPSAAEGTRTKQST